MSILCTADRQADREYTAMGEKKKKKKVALGGSELEVNPQRW